MLDAHRRRHLRRLVRCTRDHLHGHNPFFSYRESVLLAHARTRRGRRCGPCQLMAPQLEKAAAHFGDRCRFLKVDSDEEPEVASILKINGLPTILFINDMSVVARAEGMLMADELTGLAEHHFFGGEKPVIEGITV